MDWTSYSDQYYSALGTGSYTTRGGDTIRIPEECGRVDTSQEHSCGDVTFADVMVNSERNVPRFFDKNHRGIYGTTQRGLKSRLNHFGCFGYFLIYSSELDYFWPNHRSGQWAGNRKIGDVEWDGEYYWNNSAYSGELLYFRPMKSKKLGPYYLACILRSSCSIVMLWQRLYDTILGIKDSSYYFSYWKIQES